MQPQDAGVGHCCAAVCAPGRAALASAAPPLRPPLHQGGTLPREASADPWAALIAAGQHGGRRRDDRRRARQPGPAARAIGVAARWPV